MHPPAGLAQDQQNPGWFVPNQPRPAAPPGACRRARAGAPRRSTACRRIPPADEAGRGAAAADPGAVAAARRRFRPIPKGPPTPAAIVGILSVPDVLRVSTAYQAADKEFNERHKKLNEDAQKEQAALRDLGQQLGERARQADAGANPPRRSASCRTASPTRGASSASATGSSRKPAST